jgi:hypothetical protein
MYENVILTKCIAFIKNAGHSQKLPTIGIWCGVSMGIKGLLAAHYVGGLSLKWL